MTYREWERYERERLASRNGVANDLRAENAELRAALKALVKKTGVEFRNNQFICKTCRFDSTHEDMSQHYPDCAWWNAVQALGSE